MTSSPRRITCSACVCGSNSNWGGVLEALHVAVDPAPRLIPAHEALVDLHASLGQTSGEIEQLEALAAFDASRPDRNIELGLGLAV